MVLSLGKYCDCYRHTQNPAENKRSGHALLHGQNQGIRWQEIYFSPWHDFYFAMRNKNHAMAWPGWLWRKQNHAMACPADPGGKQIMPWLGPAALAGKKTGHGSRARPAAASTGQALHLHTFCAYACAPAWGEKSCMRKKSSHGCQPGSRNKNQVMARPSWPCEKKSGHGSGGLAELTNCHDLIFISAKNPAAGNFAIGRMP